MITELFNPADVRRILQIPLHLQGFDDFIAWHPNRTGTFSVRSAYHMQWMHRFRGHATMEGHPGVSTPLVVWKTLWKLQVPRKVQIFGWRILRGIIPLRAILANRHIGSNGACPTCNQGVEDIRHLLFLCTNAKELWRRLGVTHIIDRAIHVDRSGSAILNLYCLYETSSSRFIKT